VSGFCCSGAGIVAAGFVSTAQYFLGVPL